MNHIKKRIPIDDKSIHLQLTNMHLYGVVARQFREIKEHYNLKTNIQTIYFMIAEYYYEIYSKSRDDKASLLGKPNGEHLSQDKPSEDMELFLDVVPKSSQGFKFTKENVNYLDED